MKRIILSIFLLLGVANFQFSIFNFQIGQANAQTRQDAMYIFRNDGQFNAFFFDDIERIDFSMVDTLGALHDEYVVQEIYALDTLYRIPLSAIDSVSFITPETKYKEGVVKMEERLQDYITAVDGMTLTLAANTPSNLLPQKGTKLSLLETDDRFPYGFAGEVASVESGGGGYTVVCDSVELTDLFDQLVIKVAAQGVHNPEVKEARVRRPDRAQAGGRRRAEYELEPTHIDLPTIEGSYSLTSSFGFTDELSADIGASVGLKLEPSMDIRAFLYVGLLTGMQFTSTVRAQLNTELSLGISGAFTCHVDLPITTIPIPLGQPFIREDADFGFFTEGSGSLNTTYTIKSSSRVYGYANLSSDLYGTREIDANAKILSFSDEWSALTGKVSIAAGVYIEAATVVLKKNVAKASLRGDAGIRIDLEAELKAEDFTRLNAAMPADKMQTALADKSLIYDMLNRDASVKIMGFTDVQAIAKAGSWTNSKKYEETFPLSWGGSGGLVPRIFDVQATPDPYDDTHTTLSLSAARNTPFPHRIGFTVVDDKGKLVGTTWSSGEYWRGEPGRFDIEAMGLQPGIKYTAYPMTSFFKWELPVNQPVEFTTTIEGLKLSKELLSVEYDDTDMKTVNIGTNCTGLEVKPEKEYPWLTVELVKKTLQVICTENTGTDIREAIFTVSGTDPKGQKLTAKLLVSQLPEIHGFLMVKQEDSDGAMNHDPSWFNAPLHVVPTQEEQTEDGWEPYDMGMGIPLYDCNTDIEDIFKRHRYMEPDEQGNFSLVKDGLTMKGTFDRKKGTGSGTFQLSTSYLYKQASLEALTNYYRYKIENDDILTFNSWVEGTLAHEAKGTFTINVSSEGESTYVFTLKGEGTFRLDGTYIDQITNWEANNFLAGIEHPNAQLHTNTLSLYPGCTDPYYGNVQPCTFTISDWKLYYRFEE
ncbi:MAG: BACON domain-containing protein [Bacteroidaceae bacterium]|nr:BACON domain-containing protein [Bacteroidaceae bacterium]